jgi:heterodisulfide reductase subunit A-like polyferredoxin
MQFIDEPFRHTPVYATTQVLVVGGGSAGTAAAVAAARNGAKTMLVEVEGRKWVMETVDQLRRDLPQFKHAHICDIATQIGITESRRMLGE